MDKDDILLFGWLFLVIIIFFIIMGYNIHDEIVKDNNCKNYGFDGYSYTEKIINGNILTGSCYHYKTVCEPYELQTHTECKNKIKVFE